MNYQFTIIEKDWYKRRHPNKTVVKPIRVSIPDYQPIHNQFCHMHVDYDDGSNKTLIARVLLNKITQQWTVDGMSVAVRVSELTTEHLD
ncbi:hypothetical protein [Thalassotalea fusca]